MNSNGRRVLVWLAAALACHLLVALAVAFALTFAEPRFGATSYTAPAYTNRFVMADSNVDSWKPMLSAYRHRTTDPTHRLYDIFFVEQVKFQYTPSSLLFLDLIPRSMIAKPDQGGAVDPTLRWWLNALSMAAVLLTALGSAIILEVRLAQLNPGRRVRGGEVLLRALLVAGLALTYYPLLKGYNLGQIQVFLGFLVTLTILFHLLGRYALSGVFLGFCCLVKPHFGVLLLWGLLRRRWRFTIGLGVVFLLGVGLAVGRFGLTDHLDYIRVLQALSNSGETYWPNQSVNGLMNRLLENGDPYPFFASEFPPYHPVVYAVTLCSSLAILGVALLPWRLRRPPVAGPVDMLIMLVAATMASPIAWEHHYGAFFPVFAAILPELVRTRPVGRWTVPLFAVSYLAMAGVAAYPQAIFVNRWQGLIGSHLFFGAVILFVLLLRLRAANESAASSTPTVTSGEAHGEIQTLGPDKGTSCN